MRVISLSRHQISRMLYLDKAVLKRSSNHSNGCAWEEKIQQPRKKSVALATSQKQRERRRGRWMIKVYMMKMVLLRAYTATFLLSKIQFKRNQSFLLLHRVNIKKNVRRSAESKNCRKVQMYRRLRSFQTTRSSGISWLMCRVNLMV